MLFYWQQSNTFPKNIVENNLKTYSSSYEQKIQAPFINKLERLIKLPNDNE